MLQFQTGKNRVEIPGEPETGRMEEDLPGADSGTGGGDSAPGDVPAGSDPGGDISSGAGGSDEVLHMPKLLLESCSLSGQRLTAGSEYELELKLKNRNKQRKACNLKVTLSPGEEASYAGKEF